MKQNGFQGTKPWVKGCGESGNGQGREEERVSIPCVLSVFEENKVQCQCNGGMERLNSL